jgi:hypothetical protein
MPSTQTLSQAATFWGVIHLSLNHLLPAKLPMSSFLLSLMKRVQKLLDLIGLFIWVLTFLPCDAPRNVTNLGAFFLLSISLLLVYFTGCYHTLRAKGKVFPSPALPSRKLKSKWEFNEISICYYYIQGWHWCVTGIISCWLTPKSMEQVDQVRF